MPVDSNARLANAIRWGQATEPVSQSPSHDRRIGQVQSVQSDGTCTITIGGDPEPVPGVHSEANYIPMAGDVVQVDVEDMEVTIRGKYGTSPTVFRGVKVAAPVASDETISGGSYGDVTTPGPSATVTVGESGVLLVVVSCTMTVTDNNDGGFMSFALSGANTLAPSDAMALQFFPKVTGAYSRGSYVELLTGLTPGVTTVTAKYKTSGADITFKDRKLTAAPL